MHPARSSLCCCACRSHSQHPLPPPGGHATGSGQIIIARECREAGHGRTEGLHQLRYGRGFRHLFARRRRGVHAVHHPRQRRLRISRLRPARDGAHRARRQAPRRAGGLAPQPARPAGLRPARNAPGARGNHRHGHLPDRRAEGIPRRRRDGAVAHQAARRALWHGAARSGGGRGDRRRGARVRRPGLRVRQLRHVGGVHAARHSVRVRVLFRPRLQRRGAQHHHARTPSGVAAGCGAARPPRGDRGKDARRVRQGCRRGRGVRSACTATRRARWRSRGRCGRRWRSFSSRPCIRRGRERMPTKGGCEDAKDRARCRVACGRPVWRHDGARRRPVVAGESLRHGLRQAGVDRLCAAAEGGQAVERVRAVPAHEGHVLGRGRLRHRRGSQAHGRQHDALRGRRLREPAEATGAVRRLHGGEFRCHHRRPDLRGRADPQDARGARRPASR